jgi:S-formylglutathione hydrolase FrmB
MAMQTIEVWRNVASSSVAFVGAVTMCNTSMDRQTIEVHASYTVQHDTRTGAASMGLAGQSCVRTWLLGQCMRIQKSAKVS